MGNWDELGIEKNDGPAYWKPADDTPETIRGKVVDLGIFTDQDEKRHPQVTLEVDGEELVVTAFRSILAQELNSVEDLAIGDELEIKFEGKPKGKRYFVYRVKKIAAAPKRAAKGVDTKEEF
jgi:hypothetical protein